MTVVREKALTTNANPQQIIGEATEEIPESVREALPSVPAISKTAKLVIDGPYSKISSGEDFLLFDSGADIPIESSFFQRKEILKFGLFLIIGSATTALNVRKLMSLAFVPPQGVIKSFKGLANSQFYQQHEEILHPLMDYFEDK
ncbi:hypothetical protein ILUMI_13523 [Ignelater luminosus]|uniref:Uncharacterized protein n=1 Tax=Ignelater luminosus TaxID=2038154 RepID=A0A8K0GAU2_IGNLU|nr:hypothetical protein ILUMI_13523 [Ignelater luminosus]